MMRRYKRITIVVALAGAVIGGSAINAQQQQPSPPSPTQTPASEPTWQQKYEALEQRLRIIERKLELKQEAEATAAKEPVAQAKGQAAQAKETPIVKAGQDGFSLESSDGNFVLRLRGYAQADGRFYLDDSAKNGADTFLMRKVRPILEGTLYRDFDFRLMPDFGSGQALLQDAYLEWRHWPWLKVRAGKYKPPVGLEQLQQDQWLFFAERGLPSDVVPNRDVGVQLSGDLFGGVVSYAGGIFNGVVDGGIADTDAWDSKDGAARIFIQPFKKTDIGPLKGLGFGVGGTVGNQQFTSSSTNLPTYKTTGQLQFFSFRSGVAPDGVEVRGTPQGYYYWGPFGLLGEYVIADQEVRAGTLLDHVRNTAWQVEASFVLTGESATYNGVTPRHPFDLKRGGWGAFEIVGRYGDLHIDPSAFSSAPTALRFADPTKSAQEAREWGVGLNWYLNKNVKLVLDYEQTDFDGGAGTTVGTPATAYTVKDRQTERVVIGRTQFTF
jgi:phosphate-selective porin OprO and OprP